MVLPENSLQQLITYSEEQSISSSEQVFYLWRAIAEEQPSRLAVPS